MSSAALLLKSRQAHGAGVVELVVWRVPEPVPPSEHGFKYRLVYVVQGQRVVGYDNERGKGDHRHLGERELPYRFSTVDQLLADFMADVERAG
ncbi:MAG TPA: DUF6516 family protein [Aquabacterium sp.]|nr:DUF6516 family protein [Aquabacterium sp.]HQC95782.1 DUF6516 family protein [Aquabacterium sp.]